MIKAIGYIRVSTEEQAKEGVSLENQEAKIRAYCNLKDFELIEIIEEKTKGVRKGYDSSLLSKKNSRSASHTKRLNPL